MNEVEIFRQALESKLSLLPEWILSMPGMSGRRYRSFINGLVRLVPEPRYLEIGSLTGSTVCSAMYDNNGRFTCIENWSEFGGVKNKTTLLHNISMCQNPSNKFCLVESDFRRVGWISKFNIYLYDGPHQYQDQLDGIKLVLPALDDIFFLIVDDWNYYQVRQGTKEGLKKTKVLDSFEILTTDDGFHPAIWGPDSDWHNGMFLAVIEKVTS